MAYLKNMLEHSDQKTGAKLDCTRIDQSVTIALRIDE